MIIQLLPAIYLAHHGQTAQFFLFSLNVNQTIWSPSALIKIQHDGNENLSLCSKERKTIQLIFLPSDSILIISLTPANKIPSQTLNHTVCSGDWCHVHGLKRGGDAGSSNSGR